MLKCRNMPVSGLCSDIPLIKKNGLKKGPEYQHLDLAFTGFVHRISLCLPFWQSSALNLILSGWDLPLCMTALFLQCFTSLAPKCRLIMKAVYFSSQWNILSPKQLNVVYISNDVQELRLAGLMLPESCGRHIPHSTVTAIYLFKFPFCALFKG